MPVTDRREPAVYVTIEDASYVSTTTEIGRTVFGVILCDKGPHNRVVTVTSRAEYQKLFGKPNYNKCSQTHYQLDKALEYTGKVLAIRIVPENSYIAYSAIVKSDTFTTITAAGSGNFQFTKDSKTVVCATNSEYAQIEIGSWIYLTSTTSADAYQVVSKDTDPGYTFVLDRAFELSTVTVTELNVIEQYAASQLTSVGTTLSKPNESLPGTMVDSNSIDTSYNKNKIHSGNYDTSCVYSFFANGAGSYYNRFKIKGVRNTQMDRMFTDSDGNVLYKYCFMDIWINEIADDGTESLAEGPWTVSLIRKTPKGEIIRDLSSGVILFIEDVINNNSQIMQCYSSGGADDLISGTDSEDKRLQVMLLLSSSTPLGTTNIAGGGVQLENGTDGTGDYALYNDAGYYSPSDKLLGLVAQAYEGVGPYDDGESYDGSIEQIAEAVYPWYDIDYIVSGGYASTVQESARSLADYRQDCIHLADTYPMRVSYKQDLTARLEEYDWNVWTSALYVQYRKMFDNYTGEYMWMSPVYHAIERHLYCDGAYFIAEPVAGIEKGAIQDSIELAYVCDHTQRGDLQDAELNFTIYEPDGKYFLIQFTTWKRLSILKRLHVAKFVAYLRKVIPTLLKDILQRKATQYWIKQAKTRVDTLLTKFLENPALERYSILKSFATTVAFDDVASELNVYVNITPIRAIERINVYIIVH